MNKEFDEITYEICLELLHLLLTKPYVANSQKFQ